MNFSAQSSIFNLQSSIFNSSIPPRFADEGLARDDGGVLRGEAHGEGLQVPALQPPVLARRELRPGLDGDDAGRETRIGPRLGPYGHARADRKSGQPLFRNLD